MSQVPLLAALAAIFGGPHHTQAPGALPSRRPRRRQRSMGVAVEEGRIRTNHGAKVMRRQKVCIEALNLCLEGRGTRAVRNRLDSMRTCARPTGKQIRKLRKAMRNAAGEATRG